LKTFGILFSLLFMLFFRPAAAQAAYLTGDDLLKKCNSDKMSEIYSCIHYVAGVVDYQLMMQSMGTAPMLDFCLPENIPIARVTVVVMDFLKKNPQNGSFIAAPTVTMALNDKFPCGKPLTRKQAAKKKKKHK
jgi:hypothetical protein